MGGWAAVWGGACRLLALGLAAAAVAAGDRPAQAADREADEVEGDEAFLRPDIDPVLRTKIDAAIVRGVEHLRGKLQAKLEEVKDWHPSPAVRGARANLEQHPVGHVALYALTLIKCGDGPGNELVDRAMAWLRERHPRQELFMGTYDVSVTLMALQAYLHHPASLRRTEEERRADLEWARKMAFWLMSGSNDGGWAYVCPGYIESGGEYPMPGPRQPRSAEEGREARARERRARRERDRGGSGEAEVPDPAEVVRFRTPPDLPGFHAPPRGFGDRSNTQYAVLGLQAASRLGIAFPDRFWDRIALRCLDSQMGDGEEVDLLFTREWRYELSGEERSARHANGWGYGNFGPPVRSSGVSASMTVAGLAILRVAQDHVTQAPVRKRIPVALEDGWAWLQRHFTVTANPCYNQAEAPAVPVLDPSPANRPLTLYYLYGLERAGVFCQVRHVGGHDWYVEGAEHLCVSQLADGSWMARAEYHCMGLLFLKRASHGVVQEYEIGEMR